MLKWVETTEELHIMDIELTMDDIQPSEPNSLGQRLKAAREALQLTEKEAAQRLHLNVKFIHMMEEEDFKNGLPPTFIRGYLRSYAKLLNIREDDINSSLNQIQMKSQISPTTPTLPSLRIPITKKNDRYMHWITASIILVLIVMVGTWWNSHTLYKYKLPSSTPAATVTAPPPEIRTEPAPAPVTPEPAAATPLPPEPIVTPEPSVPAAILPSAVLPTATPIEEAVIPEPPKPKRKRVPVHEESTHMSLPEPGLEELD